MELNKWLNKKIRTLTFFDFLTIFLCIGLGCWIRGLFIDLKFSDYIVCLKPWVDLFKEYGGFHGLKYEIGNYTPAYMHILMLISYLDVEPVYPIKIVAIIVDVALAAMTALFFGYRKPVYVKISVFALGFLLPTMIVNSGVWGQCDNFYAFFIVCALYAVIKDAEMSLEFGRRSMVLRTDDLFMIFLGAAFSFKIQTVFLLPLFVLIFLLRNYRMLTLLWVPAIYFVTILPSLLAGRPLRNLLTIYLRQTRDFEALQLEFPNIYSFWQSELLAKDFSKGCILFCGAFLVLIVYYLYYKKITIGLGMICSLGTFSVFLITFLLPHMHDRYAYVGELLSLYYPMENRKKIWIPVLAELLALESYSVTLLWFSFDGFPIWAAILRLILIIATGTDVLVRVKNEKTG